MKKFSLSALLLVFLTILLFTIPQACADHDLATPLNVDCTGVAEISYAGSVKPIIEAKCAIPDCHNGGNPRPNWNILNNLQEKGMEIQRRITLPLNHPDKMPRTGSISQVEREAIYCWIEQGAKDN